MAQILADTGRFGAGIKGFSTLFQKESNLVGAAVLLVGSILVYARESTSMRMRSVRTDAFGFCGSRPRPEMPPLLPPEEPGSPK